MKLRKFNQEKFKPEGFTLVELLVIVAIGSFMVLAMLALGAVYVPKAGVELSSNSDFHGSIVAQSIDLSSYARIHYDEALADLNIVAAGESSSYNIKS